MSSGRHKRLAGTSVRQGLTQQPPAAATYRAGCKGRWTASRDEKGLIKSGKGEEHATHTRRCSPHPGREPLNVWGNIHTQQRPQHRTPPNTWMKPLISLATTDIPPLNIPCSVFFSSLQGDKCGKKTSAGICSCYYPHKRYFSYPDPFFSSPIRYETKGDGAKACR